jgi:hypothetical protein
MVLYDADHRKRNAALVAPRCQVKDQDNQRHHEQQMNQATRNVKTEPEQPKDQKDYKDCPEHIISLPTGCAPGMLFPTPGTQELL